MKADWVRVGRVTVPVAAVVLAIFLLGWSNTLAHPTAAFAVELAAMLVIAGVIGWHSYQLGRIEESWKWRRREGVELARTARHLEVIEVAIELVHARHQGDTEDVCRHQDRLTKAVLALATLPPSARP